jgi:DNA-binding transcriptional LysR family regulator
LERIIMDPAPIASRLKLHDVRLLIAVVEAGTMVKAAAQLGTSQPAISRSIGELEHAVGARLLDRGPRGIEPTAFGRAFIRRAIAALDELKEGVKEVKLLADPSAGELSIGASLAIAAGFVGAVLNRVASDFPRMKFNLLTGLLETTVAALRERKLDLIVTRMVAPIVDDQLETEILYDEPHVVVASARSKWARRRNLKLADLINEPWTLPSPDSPYAAYFVEAFRAVGLEYPRASIVAYMNPVRNAIVSQGPFLTIAPETVVQFAGSGMGLKALPIDLPTMRVPIGIVTLKKRVLSPSAEFFLTRCREFAKPLTARGAASSRVRGSGQNSSGR